MNNRNVGNLVVSAAQTVKIAGAGSLLVCASVASAHHTYAMFDLRQSAVIEGTVAKLEWTNPHTFVWIYVKKPGDAGGYDLWAFENGPIFLMRRQGWTPDSLTEGEKVVVQYFPLRDGRNGGHLVRIVREDGSELIGDPFAPGVAGALETGELEAPGTTDVLEVER
jgi:hypothetical protein